MTLHICVLTSTTQTVTTQSSSYSSMQMSTSEILFKKSSLYVPLISSTIRPLKHNYMYHGNYMHNGNYMYHHPALSSSIFMSYTAYCSK